MSYNIVKTDGSALVTINDGQINATSSSLILVGKNYPGYGQFINQNFVKILENFNNSSAPTAPLQGQLWFNSQTRVLSVYSNNAWKTISGAQNQADEPVNKVAGDLWFDSVNQQLKIWSGATFVLIGPTFTSATGASGAFAETVTDTSQFTHVVVKFLVQNRLVAVLSKDAAFTPATALPGFAVIFPGMNLASGQGLVFYADAYNSQRLGGVLAARFARTDVAPIFTTGVVIASPTGGLEIRETDGTTQDFIITATSSRINFSGARTGWGMKFIVKPSNNAGSTFDALTIDSTTGELIAGYSTPLQNQGLSTKTYVDTAVTGITAYADTIAQAAQSYTNTVWANANVTYGNVRTIQSALGFIQGVSTDYNRIVSGGGTNFASNLIGLWDEVRTIQANVLTGYIVGATPVTSLWSNVQTQSTRIKTLEDNTLRSDGAVTIKGILRADATGSRDLGTDAVRFATIFSGEIDTPNVTAVSNFSTTSEVPNTNALRITAAASTMNLFGNVRITGNLVFDQTNAVNGSAAGVASPIHIWGAVTHNADIRPLADNTRNMGAADKRYANMYAVTFRGTATAAQYADLAERYAADQEYPVGTVIEIGGEQEITVVTQDASESVFGVISLAPAYLMNSEAGSDATHPPVALAGRVPVRVEGTVLKGQRLVSTPRGTARVAADGEATPFNVIGRALENKTSTEEALIQAAVRLGV